MYVFPKFSSFFTFFITFSTALILFTHIINGAGIICILMFMYLLLHVGNKVTSLGCVVFTIVTCLSICEVKVIYDVLPKIFLQFSNCLIFIISHIFLIHYGALMFLEFGIDKLKKEEYEYFSDTTLMLFITFPLIIAAIWSYVCSLYIDLSCIPFLFQLIIFVLYQALQLTHGVASFPIASSNKKEVPLIMSFIQFISGIAVNVVITISLLFQSSMSWNQIIIDHLAIWSLALLFTALLPSTRVLESYIPVTQRHIKLTTLISGISCYALVLPVLHSHGVHFHTARLVFFEVLSLGVGLISVATYPRRWIGILITLTIVLVIAFAYEMPWGVQLLPRTTFFLERIYLSIIAMSMAAVVGIRVLVNSNRVGRRTIAFELAFVVLVTVFHSSEWSLYFTNLAPMALTFATGIFLLVVQLCFFSFCRISTITSSVIDSQLILKLIVLAIHYSINNRVSIPTTSILATLVAAFIMSHSFKSLSSMSLTVSFVKGIFLFTSIVIMRDPIFMFLAYGVTGEEIVTQMSILQCLGLTLFLDFITNLKIQKPFKLSKSSQIRALLLAISTSFMVNRILPVSIILMGIFIIWQWKDDRWIFARATQRSVILAVGCVLFAIATLGPSLVDNGLMLLVIISGHITVQLASQSSIRIFKRFFMRIWILGMIIWVLELVFGSNTFLQYAITVGYPLTVALVLARGKGCLETSLEANSVTVDMSKVLRKIRSISVIQCFIGGIIACRFDFGCPQVLVLPLVLILLERHKCVCEYKELASKQVNIVSLIVSSLALILLFSTVQKSPLLLTSALTSAQHLSLQLDLAINVQAWFEMVLTCLLGLCHVLMLVLSIMSVTPHDCTQTSQIANLDCWLVCYTAIIPMSLGFVFCSTSFSSAALALLSASAGARNLLL